MILRLLLCGIIAAFSLSGCANDAKKQKEAEKKKEKAAKPAMKDVSGDTGFQAFTGRLRTAVAQRDRNVLQSMLAPDFGYRWDTPPPGETPFDYWDQNNLWPELEALLSDRWLPHENYMVVPPKFVTDESYRGYRAGVRLFNGSWRLAYFVTGDDVLQ